MCFVLPKYVLPLSSLLSSRVFSERCVERGLKALEGNVPGVIKQMLSDIGMHAPWPVVRVVRVQNIQSHGSHNFINHSLSIIL